MKETIEDAIAGRIQSCRKRYGPYYDVVLDQAKTAVVMEMHREGELSSRFSAVFAAVQLGLRDELTEYVDDDRDAFHFLIHAALLIQTGVTTQ